jgi:hypothetical protein
MTDIMETMATTTIVVDIGTITAMAMITVMMATGNTMEKGEAMERAGDMEEALTAGAAIANLLPLILTYLSGG